MMKEKPPQDLSRLHPDGWAISWSNRQVLLLERAHDWRQDWCEATGTFKTGRYKQLQERMQGLLPQGWAVEVIPLTVGIRGSLHEPTWRRILDRFGFDSQATQTRFLQELSRQALKELDHMHGVCSEALRKLHTR